MKTKIFPVLFAFIICVVLVVGCIPVGASDIDINPDGNNVLQPISIEFDIDDTDDIVAFYTSPRDVVNSTENFVYGNTTPINYVCGTQSAVTGSSYYIVDETFENISIYDCWVTFPDFHFDTSSSSPPAANAYIYLPEAGDYVSAYWTADVTYYSRNDGQKYRVTFSQSVGDSGSPYQISIPINEIYQTYLPHYDYVNVSNLRCAISSTDGECDYLTVTSSVGQFVEVGVLLPDAIITEVTEVTPNLFDWIITPLDGFLNIQIVPPDPSGDFGGATIGGILALVIAIPMLIAFLKVFAGG